MLDLFPFQKKGVEWLCQPERNRLLLADDMGLGKTIQTIACINQLGVEKVLIVCPTTIKYNWQRELTKHLDKPLGIQVISGGRDKLTNAHIHIISYGLVHRPLLYKRLQQIDYELVVCDEAHYLKNAEAKRTQALLCDGGPIVRSGRTIFLTGTPVLNRPIELWPLLYQCNRSLLGQYADYNEYAKRYCGGFFDRRYRKMIAKGATNTEELAKRIQPFILRRIKDEVAEELPSKMEKYVYLDYEEHVNSDTPTATVRRQVAEAKIEKAIEYITELLQTQHKLVVFAYHRNVIETLKKELSDFDPALVMGGMSAEKKQAEIDKFCKHKDSRVFIGQILAAGQGVDGLQKVCNHIIFVEQDWSPGVMDQAVDRCRRIGQEKTVWVYYLVAKNSIDQAVVGSLRSKRRVIDKLLTVEKETDMSDFEKVAHMFADIVADKIIRVLKETESVEKTEETEQEEKPKAKRGRKKPEAKVTETNPVEEQANKEIKPAEPEPIEIPKPMSLDDLKAVVANKYLNQVPAEQVSQLMAFTKKEIIEGLGGVERLDHIPETKRAEIAKVFEAGPEAAGFVYQPEDMNL